MYTPIFIIVAKLLIQWTTGYLIFQPRIMRRYILPPAMFLIMKVMFPLHFVWNLPRGWERAVGAGWYWLVIFFTAAFLMILMQLWISKFFVKSGRLLDTEHPRSMRVLFAMHNAGFIPLPIMAVLAPLEVNIYMFMYVLGFNLVFWTAAVHMLSNSGGGFRIKINPPLIGIFVGILIAVFDLSDYIPRVIVPVLRISGTYTLDLMMILLGGVLATIPRSDLKYRPEFGKLVGLRFFLYPAGMLIVAALLPLSWLPQEIQWGLRLALVVQAAVPPATNVMLIAKLYGRDDQVHYIGTGIITTYLASLITLPIFLTIATFFFR